MKLLADAEKPGNEDLLVDLRNKWLEAEQPVPPRASTAVEEQQTSRLASGGLINRQTRRLRCLGRIPRSVVARGISSGSG